MKPPHELIARIDAVAATAVPVVPPTPAKPAVAAEAIETGRLLGDVVAFMRRFLWLPTEDAYLAVGLWIMHTHAVAAYHRVPYLAITSPERECGKTQALELLEELCARSWKIDGTPTEAVIFRKVEASCPTLLLDEADQVFKVGDQRVAALVGMLNAGYKRGATVPRCVGEGTSMETRDFSVFCPKVLAGINTAGWPDTLMSRCVRIALHRLPPRQRVERWRSDREAATTGSLRRRLEVWGQSNEEELRAYRSPEVDALSPRAEEIWEPLLSVAALAGREAEALAAAVALGLSDEVCVVGVTDSARVGREDIDERDECAVP